MYRESFRNTASDSSLASKMVRMRAIMLPKQPEQLDTLIRRASVSWLLGRLA